MAFSSTENVNDGALWSHKSKGGATYYKGKIDGVDYVMFANVSNNPKAPAFTLKKADVRDDD